MTFYTVRPLVDFTVFKRTGKRRPNPYPVATWSWAGTLKLLEFELAKIGGSHVVLMLACDESEIRRDGMLYSRAEVKHPGVVLAFDSNHGPLSYATDTFEGRWPVDPPDWQINTRAIALGLEALRKIDRYGIGAYGQQYAGYKALPAGNGAATHMTRTEAQGLLFMLAGLDVQPDLVTNPDNRSRVLRAARATAHPDRHGGDRTLWDQVEQAAQVLGMVNTS
jgi:hypothetical protein